MTTIRDDHFAIARQAVTGASDEADAARRAVLLITLAALGIAVAVACTSRACGGGAAEAAGVAQTRSASRFRDRIDVTSRDELGELASAFNQMAEDLAEFRRTNINEVVRAKTRLKPRWKPCLTPSSCWTPPAASSRSIVPPSTLLEAAGVRAPKRLHDLHLEGFDGTAAAAAMTAGIDAALPTDLARTIRIEHAGAVRRLLPRVVPVPALTTERRGAILLLADVTELVRLDEMRSELVSVASLSSCKHPWPTLRMTLLMLQEGSELLPKRQQDLVATSLIGVEQLAEIVHEFLDLARIEAGELRLNLERLHLPSLVAEAVRRAGAQANARRISLRSRVDPGLARISGDPIRLRAVFDNILSNALRYAGGRQHHGRERFRRARGRGQRVDQRRRHRSGHSRGVPVAGVRQVLPSGASPVRHAPTGSRRRNRALHVPADRRSSRGNHRVRLRPGRSRHVHHGHASGGNCGRPPSG